MRVACYGSGKATRIQKIIEELKKNDYVELGVVISDCDNAQLEQKVEANHIKYVVIKPQQDKFYFSDKLLDILNEYHIDYLFVFGCEILRGAILHDYMYHIINFHPSLLPLFKGKNAIQRAVEFGMPYLGNTAHFIDDNIDGGAIILQSIVSTEVFHKYGFDGVLDCQIEMFFTLCKLFKDNRIISQKDNSVVIKGAIYEKSFFYPDISVVE